MAKPKMRRIRGEYRPFFEALFTGKDFQRLSPDAKLAYMFVKGLSGAAGIRVWPAFTEQLAELTGMPTPRTKRAIEELGAAGWVQLEGSVVWVVRGLDFEPQMCATNAKHRTWLREHLDSLPRVPLVQRFVAENVAWFTEDEVTPSDRLSDSPFDSPCDTNPYPNPVSQSLSLSPATNPGAIVADASTDRTRLAVAANKGITAQYGEQPSPIRWDAPPAHEFAQKLADAGVELEFAERIVFTVAKDRKTSDGRAPRTLKYFTDAVLDAWRREQVHRVAATSPAPVAESAPAASLDIPDAWAIAYARQGASDWQAICDARQLEWRDAS